MTEEIDIGHIRNNFLSLQESICTALSELENGPDFTSDSWEREGGGGGTSRVLADGEVFEKAGVNFSDVSGGHLPDSATENRPELAGRSFRATGLSLVIHPLNPFVPTTHMNIRFFLAEKQDADPVWWFGGGFDLTPYYGFTEDVVHWHRVARDVCSPYGDDVYPAFKKWCDEYFFIRHRNEARGVGGIFFDDLNDWGFADCYAFTRGVGENFIHAYWPIVEKRANLPFTRKHRDFQLYRRGRYVEFNLVHDRGTLFGLQSGGRTESILMSLPPQASWRYDWKPEPGSEEASLYEDFLPVRNWLNL